MDVGSLFRKTPVLLLASALLCLSAGAGEAATLHVAAAADLMPVLPHLAKAYTKKTGTPVRISWGASGELALAIRHHAPYDFFLSADANYPKRLAKDGLLVKSSLRTYAEGALVLWISDSKGEAPKGPEDLRRPFVKKVAMANPRLAPYGKASLRCLRSRGLWASTRKKVVFGNSLAQVAQYLRTGTVQAGFLSLSQALLLKTRLKGGWVTLSPGCTPFLAQAMGIVKGSPRQNEAKKFEQFILSDPSRTYLKNHGYR